MIFEYRLTKLDNSILTDMGKSGWELVTILKDVMYFKKAIKRKVNQSIGVKDKNWLEFKAAYKEIKNSGLSSNALIVNYNKKCKEGLHNDIMNNLKDYKTHLEVHKKKQYALMASSYIQQNRFEDDWEVVKVDFSTKWRSDMIKEQKIPEMYIESIMLESKKWDGTHGQNKEMTSVVFQAIIDKYYVTK